MLLSMMLIYVTIPIILILLSKQASTWATIVVLAGDLMLATHNVGYTYTTAKT